MGETEEPALGAPRHRSYVPGRAARGHQGAPEQPAAGKQPRRPHGNRRHGWTFTRVSTATAQSLATAAPPGGTRALSPRQVFAGGGDRQEGAQPPVPPHTPFFPSSTHPPSPATDGKTDGRTHLSTAHVSLTARAGFPWSMGFLKSVRSSSKAMIWERGVSPSGRGQQLRSLPPIFLRDRNSYMGTGPGGAYCTGGEIEVEGEAGPGPRSHTVWKRILVR